MISSYIGIILAGGKGSRFGSSKQDLILHKKPLWIHSLEKFTQAGFFSHLLLVVPKGHSLNYQNLLIEFNFPTVLLVEGGEERHESVSHALMASAPFINSSSYFFIHDSARPLFRMETLFLLKEALEAFPAVTLGHPVTDALKRADEKGIIHGEVERAGTWAVTTPQAFHAKTLLDLFQTNQTFGYDETYLFTQKGLPVKIIAADRYNLKITYPEDFEVAKRLF